MATVNTSETNKEYILSVSLKLDPEIQRALDTLGKMRKELDSVASDLKKASKEFATQGGDATKAADALKKYNDALKGVDSTQSGMRGSADAQRSMQGWAAAMAQFEAELTTLPQKMTLVQQKLKELQSAGQQGGASWQAYSAELRRLSDVQNKLDSANRGSTEGFKSMRFAAQNASYQLTDMAVQFQMGTRASVVFAQQVPQILGSFGAWGAAAGLVVALSASIAGPLIDSLFKGANAAKDLSEAQTAANETLSLLGKTAKTFSMDGLIKEFNAANGVTRIVIREQLALQATLLETQRIMAEQSFAKAFSGIAEVGTMDKLFNAFGDTATRVGKNLGVAAQDAAGLTSAIRAVAAGTMEAATFNAEWGQVLAKSVNPEAQKLLKTSMDMEKSQRDIAAGQSKSSEYMKKFADAGATGQVVLENQAKAAKAAQVAVKDLNDEFALTRDVFLEMSKIAAPKFEGPVRSEIIKENMATWQEWGITQEQITKKLADADEAARKSIGTWDTYDEVIKSVNEEQKKLNDYILAGQRIAQMADAGLIDPEKYQQMLVVLEKMKPALADAGESAKATASDLQAMAVAVGTTLANSIGGFVDVLLESRKSFKEWAADVLAELGKVLIKMAAVAAFKRAVAGTSFAALFGFASGAAFAGGQIGLPHNTVINQPTPFLFAQGGVFGARSGVAGEAGEEAVVPLKRTSGGDLGVSASPVVINVNNTMSGTAGVEVVENQKADGTREITLTIRREMKSALSDGSMDSTMRSNYGVARRAGT